MLHLRCDAYFVCEAEIRQRGWAPHSIELHFFGGNAGVEPAIVRREDEVFFGRLAMAQPLACAFVQALFFASARDAGIYFRDDAIRVYPNEGTPPVSWLDALREDRNAARARIVASIAAMPPLTRNG